MSDEILDQQQFVEDFDEQQEYQKHLEQRIEELQTKLADMTLARDELQKLHDITIAKLEAQLDKPQNGEVTVEVEYLQSWIDRTRALEAQIKACRPYLKHTQECLLVESHNYSPCTCRLNNILSRLNSILGEKDE